MSVTPKLFPGFWFAALLCVIVIAIQSLFIVPFVVAGLLTKLPLMSHPVVLAFVNVAAFALTLLAGWLIGRVPPRDWLPVRSVPLALYPIAALTCLGAVLLVSEADNLLRVVLPMPKFVEEAFNQMFSVVKHPFGAFVLLVIVAPVTEEILFRGMILHGFRTRFTAARAVTGCAFLFACLHMNPWQFFGAFGLGLIFGWWLLRTNCLWLCLFGHAVANGSLLLVGFLPWEVPGLKPAEGNLIATGFQPWWLDLAGVGLVAGGLWLFHLVAPRPAATVEALPADPPALPPILPPVAPGS